MNKFFTTLLTLAALGLAAPAFAAGCEWTTSNPDQTVAAGPATIYIDNDACQTDGSCLFSFWIYQESNDIEGLQRADTVIDDTCGGAIDGDTVIF